MATSTIYANRFYNIKEKLKNSKANYEEVKRKSAEFEKKYASLMQDEPIEKGDPVVTTGTINVGVDTTNMPIYFAYLSAGDIKNNCGTIVCADDLFGSHGYKQQAKLWAKAGFYVIAFDGLGVGLSSYNDPVAMDNIGGYPGYSYQQLAYLRHQALINLGINQNTPETPITYCACDFEGTVGFLYAYMYQDDPYGLSFYVSENTNFGVVSSTDPCSISLLNPTVAQEVADAYASDPCAILCSLNSGAFNQPGLPGDFTEIDCPDFGNFALNTSINYGATMPASVFTRQLVNSSTFDPSPLMAQVKIPVLIIYAGIFQLPINKQTGLLPLYGICYGCQTGCDCTNASTYVQPCPNSICLCYQNAGTSCHTTRSKRFNADVLGFITGASGQCDPYLNLKVDVNAGCPNPSCTPSNP